VPVTAVAMLVHLFRAFHRWNTTGRDAGDAEGDRR